MIIYALIVSGIMMGDTGAFAVSTHKTLKECEIAKVEVMKSELRPEVTHIGYDCVKLNLKPVTKK